MPYDGRRTGGQALRSWRESLDDTVGRGNWLHLGQAQASLGQELAVLGAGTFLATDDDQHGQIAQQDRHGIGRVLIIERLIPEDPADRTPRSQRTRTPRMIVRRARNALPVGQSAAHTGSYPRAGAAKRSQETVTLFLALPGGE